ncbi:protein jag [Clostridia bacterium]|nr:protein jag [Clostridia bacterium]
MESKVFTGKTVEEAVTEALNEFRVLREEVEIEVLAEPKSGIFGILGNKDAAVRVTKIEKPSKNVIAIEFLEKVCEQMGVVVTIEVDEKGDYTYLSMTGENLGVLIGRRGETLDALQYLLNLAVNKKTGEKPHIILDVEGYRAKRRQTLERLAQNLAKKAKRTQRSIVLEPMNPQERRIIHTTLQDHPYVYTASEGEEPYRKVVIILK